MHTERASLDRQREDMEQERRNIAAQRQRDPIVAQTISAVGLTLACLLPLLLAGYVVYSLNRSSDDNDALSELLIMEMTADQPLLLPSSLPTVAAIEHTRSSLDAFNEPDQADDQWTMTRTRATGFRTVSCVYCAFGRRRAQPPINRPISSIARLANS